MFGVFHEDVRRVTFSKLPPHFFLALRPHLCWLRMSETLISVGARQVEEQKGDNLGIASAEGDQDLGIQVRRHRSSSWEIVARAKQL